MIFAAIMLQVAATESPASPGSVAAAYSVPMKLAAGTSVRLATTGPIDSRSIRQGQRFALVVTEDVMADGHVAIPKGTPATGEIVSVTEKGVFGKGAAFSIQPLFVDWGGQRIVLTGNLETQGKKQVTAAAATTLVTTFGVFITGKSAILPANSPLTGYVRTEVKFAPTGH